jgi:hypothetical protein
VELLAAGLLALLLFTASASAPAVPDAALEVDSVAAADVLPPCGSGVLYRNLTVPAQQAAYQNADGQPCDPDGGR